MGWEFIKYISNDITKRCNSIPVIFAYLRSRIIFFFFPALHHDQVSSFYYGSVSLIYKNKITNIVNPQQTKKILEWGASDADFFY